MTTSIMNGVPLTERRYLKAEDLMKVLGYTDRAAFFVAVHSAGIPMVRINSRRILFDEAEVTAWLDSKKVGKVGVG